VKVNNPFAGNRAEPIKKLTRRYFKETEKYKSNYIYDTERQWCDSNESYTLLVHKDREEYLLISEKKTDEDDPTTPEIIE
jgi:hypothetical protein